MIRSWFQHLAEKININKNNRNNLNLWNGDWGNWPPNPFGKLKLMIKWKEKHAYDSCNKLKCVMYFLPSKSTTELTLLTDGFGTFLDNVQWWFDDNFFIIWCVCWLSCSWVIHYIIRYSLVAIIWNSHETSTSPKLLE